MDSRVLRAGRESEAYIGLALVRSSRMGLCPQGRGFVGSVQFGGFNQMLLSVQSGFPIKRKIKLPSKNKIKTTVKRTSTNTW